jgi:hypothetical protein
MLALQSSYTQAFNRRHGRVGHLFQGRYKAFLVETDRYWLTLLRYIHENPIKTGIVERPDQSDWSSDRFYRSGRGPARLDLDRGLSLLGPRRSAARQRYLRLMGEEDAEPYESIAGVAQVIKGDEDFALRLLEKKDDQDLIRRRLRIERVAELVARKEDLDLGYLRGATRRRRASRARAIVGYLAKVYGRIPYARTAEFFNRETSTLSKDIRALERILQASTQERKRLDLLAASLLQSNNPSIQG